MDNSSSGYGAPPPAPAAAPNYTGQPAAASGQSSLPKLSQQQLNVLLQRLSNLKFKGSNEHNDPEYLKLVTFLRNYQHSYLNNQSEYNQSPARPNTSFSGNSNVNPPQYQTNDRTTNNPQPYNQEHLKSQINSYSKLSSNQPLSKQSTEKMFNIAIQDDEDIPQVDIDSQLKETKIDLNKYFETYQPNSHKYLIPSIHPIGIDPYSIFKQKEENIKNRINLRIEELEKINANLSNLKDNQNDPFNTKNNDHENKIKLLIELKSLRLAQFQKKIREEVVKGFMNSNILVSSIDRTSLKRAKKPTLKEIRNIEKFEKQQKMEKLKREKQKENDFLLKIIQKQKDLITKRRSINNVWVKINKSVSQLHNIIEKEEAKKLDAVQKQRLELLKTGNEEEYMKLVDQAKDTRISHLIQKTENYLKALTNLVVEQQNEARPTDMLEAQQSDNNNNVDEDGENEKYFAVAHSVKEIITEQPKMLVGGKLKEYQIKGLQWMVSLYNNRLNGILADEMGLGKTIQTISLIAYLIESKRQNGPYLVIVPLSTVNNWTLEFEKWAPGIIKIVYKGTPTERRQIQLDHIRYNDFQVLITTYEYIIKDKHILNKTRWLYYIIDEGHRMKNVNSKLTITLTTQYNSRYRLILTGTPLQNNLSELWALLNFILPKIFHSSETFDDWFNTPFANSGGQEKIEINEEEKLLVIKRLHKVLRPFLLRRLKKDVESELPDKVEKVVRCKMSALQHRLYTQMRDYQRLFTTTGEKGKFGMKSLNNTIMQLRKICNHPFVFDEVEKAVNPMSLNDENLYRTSGKFELLDRILPKFFRTGHRILIFFQMTAVINIFEDFMHFRQIMYLRLDGSTKPDDRSELIKKFNDPNSPYQVFLLSTRAGGLGLNLQSADTVIIFDSDWNPHQDLQAQDRAHRIGQKKEVRILRLVTAKSVEERILSRAQHKLDIDGKVIQAGKFDNKSTAEERETFLRSLIETTNEDLNDENEDDEIYSNDYLNETISRNEAEFELFKQMDIEREQQEQTMLKINNDPKYQSRLIQENELPSMYLLDEPTESKKIDAIFGRGQRVKEQVIYNDGLSENQFLDAIENEEDIDDLIRTKREKRQRRQNRENNNSQTSSQYNDDNQNNYNTPAQNQRHSSHRKPTSQRRKSSQVERTELSKNLNKLYKSCIDIIEYYRDSYGRYLCELFRYLPNKKQYPDYYIIIQKPIALSTIKTKIKTFQYNNHHEFINDTRQMFNNARIYNEEGSDVYMDANELQDAFEQRFFSLFPSGHIPEYIEDTNAIDNIVTQLYNEDVEDEQKIENQQQQQQGLNNPQ